MGRLIRASRILIAALAAALLTIAAGPAWAGVARVAAPAAPGQAAGQLVAHAPATKHAKSPHGETVVTFAWGGGRADQMQALPIFREFGMHATYFIPSGLVCTQSSASCTHSPYLSLPDIHKIASYGNEVGGLSVLHRDLTLMPAAEAQREVCNDRMNLLHWGFHPTDFAYPFAAENPQVAQLTRRCGYNAGLGAGELRGAGACNACALAETIPPQNPMLVRAPEEVSATKGRYWSVATYQDIVTNVRNHGGGWIFFTIHDVCSKACLYGVTPHELRTVLGWLHSQRSHNVRVETMRQVIGGPVRPAVAGPVARPVPSPGVVNAKLTTATNAKRNAPLCFQHADYGQNDAKFDYSPSGGPHGEGTVTVRITKWATGGAYFLPKMDLGQCSPQVSPGRQYTVGAWYKSNHTTQLAVYYRNQVGDWLYWTTSTAFPATSSWSKASWTTPPAPAGATAVTFGLTAGANMTVTSTAYNMAPAQTHRALVLLGSLLFVLVAAALITRGQLRYRKHIREEIAAEEQRHGAVA